MPNRFLGWSEAPEGRQPRLEEERDVKNRGCGRRALYIDSCDILGQPQDIWAFQALWRVDAWCLAPASQEGPSRTREALQCMACFLVGYLLLQDWSAIKSFPLRTGP